MGEAVDDLLDTAARYKLLTAAEEIELGRLVREWLDWPGGETEAPELVKRRGKRALDSFLLANLRLARYVAKRFYNRGVAPEDLMQAATEGLLSAIRRFKPALGFKFSSYGIWWAQQACQVLIAQQGGSMRMPITVSEQLRKVSRTEERLRQELGRCPDEEEIEAGAGLRNGQLASLRFYARRSDTRSLDDCGGKSLLEYLPSDEDPAAQLEASELHTIIATLLGDGDNPLTLQQRYILRCRYLSQDPPSIVKLASRLNMNRMTVRRLEQSALRILRQQLPSSMRAYLQS